MPARRKDPTPDTITDPVEWADHYWRAQHLEGDEQRFLVMSSLLRYQRIVVELVEGELRKLGLNLTDYLMLMTLQLSESGTRLISSLARNLMVHATTATLATDRLEARKLLRRSPHPTDRRATCVTITGPAVSSCTRPPSPWTQWTSAWPGPARRTWHGSASCWIPCVPARAMPAPRPDPRQEEAIG